MPGQEKPVIDEGTPLQESWGVDFTITDEGRTKAVIQAGHAAEYRTDGKSRQHLDGGINVAFHNPEGERTTTIAADKAIIYENQDIEASGNVIITSKDSTVIRTEYARRSGEDRMIRSNRFVRINRPGQSITGYGFESDQEVKHYRIFRGSGEGILQ